MTDIKVSVLTPIYNHDVKYTRKCLESLQAQTLKECEFILIDNGATPEARALIEDFLSKDNRFTVIHFAENQGYSKAMNAGLEKANGKYIGVVESDDFIEADMYRILYQTAEKEQIDFVKCLFSFYYEKEGKTGKAGRSYPAEKYNTVLRAEQIPEIPLGHACQWAAIYNKEFLNKNDISWSTVEGAMHQDMGFMMKTWMAGERIYIIPDILYYYRQDNENQSTYRNNTVPWGSAREMRLLDEWMLRRGKKIKDLFWHVKCKREFSSKCVFLSKMTKKRISFFWKEMHEKFKNDLKKNHAGFSFFQSEEEKTYKIISFRPFKFIRKNFFNIIRTENNKLYFLGIPIRKKKTTQDTKKVSWFFGAFKYKKTNKYKKIYLFQIPVYYKKYKEMFAQYFEQQNLFLKHLDDKINSLKTIIEAQHLHPETFGKYKNAFAGKDVVLICTGPTAKYYQPLSDAIHVGVNGAVYLDNVKLDYLFVQDYTIHQKGNETLIEDAIAYTGNDCQKFFGIIPDGTLEKIEKNIKPLNYTLNKGERAIERIPFNLSLQKNIKQYILGETETRQMVYDLSREPVGDIGGTPFSALQFILFANPKRIYLVGWDCSTGYAYNKNNTLNCATSGQALMLKKYVLPNLKLNYQNIEIISVNPVGLKGMFKDIYTKDYLEDHSEINQDKIVL